MSESEPSFELKFGFLNDRTNRLRYEVQETAGTNKLKREMQKKMSESTGL